MAAIVAAIVSTLSISSKSPTDSAHITMRIPATILSAIESKIKAKANNKRSFYVSFREVRCLTSQVWVSRLYLLITSTASTNSTSVIAAPTKIIAFFSVSNNLTCSYWWRDRRENEEALGNPKCHEVKYEKSFTHVKCLVDCRLRIIWYNCSVRYY